MTTSDSQCQQRAGPWYTTLRFDLLHAILWAVGSDLLRLSCAVCVRHRTIFTMSFGDFYLSRPTDPVGFGAQPSVFAWVGK